MQSLLLRLAMILAAHLLASCAAEGQRFERQAALNSDVGVIYVYRPLTAVFARGEDPYVTIAGDQMGRLRAGGYFKKVVPIGEHRVVVNQSVLFLPTWPESIEVAVASATGTYVKVDQRVTGVAFDEGATATQQVFIEEVPGYTGQNEILGMRENS